MACSHKKNVEEINASGIRAKMCDVISEEFKKLIEEQVDRWSSFNSGKGSVKGFYNTPQKLGA